MLALAALGCQRAAPRARNHFDPLMRLRPWLAPKFAHLAHAISAYRVNARSVVFGAACWLLWSGVHAFSPPAARIALGSVFLVGLLWPERAKKGAS